MNKFFWFFSSFIYNLLGPRNAWRFAMSPLPKFIIFSTIKFFGKNELIFTSKYGFKIQIPIEEYLIGGYLHLGETNPHETKVIWKILKKGDIFLDIGAYRGWYALHAANIVGDKGKVIAFEPNPSVAEILQKNISINDFKNTSVEHIALSNTSGDQNFWVGEAEMLGSLKKEHLSINKQKSPKKLSVKTETLDSYYKRKKLHRVNMIKIDTEEADLQVIEGAKDTLKKYHPYLIVEVFGLSMNTDKKRKYEIIQYLAQLGYKTYEFYGEGLKPYINLQKDPGIINLFFAADSKELKKQHLL